MARIAKRNVRNTHPKIEENPSPEINEPSQIEDDPEEQNPESVSTLESFEDKFENEDTDYTEALRSWVNEAREVYDNQCAKITLYKYDNPLSGKDKSQINEWENYVPSRHEVGLDYGSGRYTIFCGVQGNKREGKKNLVKSRTFRLHSNYDELKRKRDLEKNSSIVQPNNLVPVNHTVNSGLDLKALILAVKELAPVIKSIIPSNNSQPQAFDMSPFLMQSFTMVQEVLKKSLFDQQKMIAEIRKFQVATDREIREESGDNEEEGREEMNETQSLIEKYAPLALEFLPMVLGDTPQSQILVKTLRALPLFKEINSDPEIKAEWIEELEKTVGKNKTDQFLKKINIQR